MRESGSTGRPSTSRRSRRRPRDLGSTREQRLFTSPGQSSAVSWGTPLRGLRQTPHHETPGARLPAATPQTVRFDLPHASYAHEDGEFRTPAPPSGLRASSVFDLDHDWSDSWITVIGHPVGREREVERLFRRVGRIVQAVPRGNQLHIQCVPKPPPSSLHSLDFTSRFSIFSRFMSREERDRALVLNKREGLLVHGQALGVTVCQEEDVMRRFSSPGNESNGPAATVAARTPGSFLRTPFSARPAGAARASLGSLGPRSSGLQGLDGSHLSLRELETSMEGNAADRAARALGASASSGWEGPVPRRRGWSGVSGDSEDDAVPRLAERSYRRDRFGVREDRNCCGWVMRLWDFLWNF